MTTDRKTRHTIYLYDGAQLDDLVELARRAVPLADRGRITRSTVCEAAVTLALAELRAAGADSALLKTVVTLPAHQTGD